jgi:spermidine synthase
MASRAHHSEEAMARLACCDLPAAPHVLIGGLGLGYTLRAALDALPGDASVDVAEVLPEVIAWNRGELRRLAGDPLSDRRVRVLCRDVAVVLREEAGCFDAVLLDVDNGPDELSLEGNRHLYTPQGLRVVRDALRAGGVLAVWSTEESATLAAALEKTGFVWRNVKVTARGEQGDPEHRVYLATRTE